MTCPDEDAAEEEAALDYPVTVPFTREGYFKKIPPQSLQCTAGAYKLKEGDEIIQQLRPETTKRCSSPTSSRCTRCVWQN